MIKTVEPLANLKIHNNSPYAPYAGVAASALECNDNDQLRLQGQDHRVRTRAHPIHL